ncbi:ABC transporter permease [Spirochaetia bacterium 38H-sp]|uniref:ABC transporter permease n=1 Tax=Rarispira pelagica TaxID=3141764 RepID=A0ABU9UEA9_9SPIR
MDIKQAVSQAFDVIRENKARSFFTILGINIGVAALIAISVIGIAFKTSINNEVGKYGSTLVWVQVNWRAYAKGEARALLDEKDLYFFNNMKGIKSGEPVLFAYLSVQAKGKRKETDIVGVGEEHFRLFDIAIENGRSFSREELEKKARMCVIGPDLARFLFGRTNVTGETLQIGAQLYTVAGVTETRNSQTEFLSDGTGNMSVFIPYTILEKLSTGTSSRKYRIYLMDFDTVEDAKKASVHIKDYLIKRYGLLRDKERFRVEQLSSYVEMIDRILSIISLIVTVIAAVSILVGGLGIMNIMLVAVTERTREIGIRRAIGAKKKDILIQFLIEAVVLCLIGGGSGLFLGLLIAWIVCAILSWSFFISSLIVFSAITGASALGIIFGLYPSYMAARLMPVEALRYEV